jgi:hypothetical protein
VATISVFSSQRTIPLSAKLGRDENRLRTIARAVGRAGVAGAGYVSAGLTDPEIRVRRIAYAYIEDGGDLNNVVDVLSDIEGVHSVQEHAARGL